MPADRFAPFAAAVSRLGEVRRNHVGTQDVTEEYFDLEARIRNKQEEEKRLVKHLAASTGNLKDILDVERELSRVRGEAEQMQGRLRFLSNRADLSTVTINATEWKDYKPPVAPTYSTQISRTFFRSVENLGTFFTSLSLVLVRAHSLDSRNRPGPALGAVAAHPPASKVAAGRVSQPPRPPVEHASAFRDPSPDTSLVWQSFGSSP